MALPVSEKSVYIGPDYHIHHKATLAESNNTLVYAELQYAF